MNPPLPALKSCSETNQTDWVRLRTLVLPETIKALPDSMLSYEYSVLLHQDGTVDFVMAGADIPGLVWTYGKVPTDAGELDGVIIDYYGQPLYLVPTDSGFDMDYFDSMRMHFAPEGSAQ